ncbi:NACHT, LRR and PYD domains-containing protein 3-like [Dendrobates tinctorius]|uniref:NACHT, LRR and PYD domains-containing protein 3-like n=1 Tax=Dendrobates tinctorius TaxID=92724 RepID=UPI003CC9527C
MAAKRRKTDDDAWQFDQQLSQYDDHTLRLIYEYFWYDLLYIVENLKLDLLLMELHSRNIPDVNKYWSLTYDEKPWARTLIQDIFDGGRETMMGLWNSLYNIQRNHYNSALNAVLEELRKRGHILVEQMLLDERGHQLSPELTEIQDIHKNHLLEKAKKHLEKIVLYTDGEENFPVYTHYTNLVIVSADHFRKWSENEFIEVGVKHEQYLKKTHNKLKHIKFNKIFHWCHQSRLVPHMVMVSGVPGVGKTILMENIIYDWVKGDLYQKFSFVFFFKFRELNRLDEVSLETLILHQYPYLEEQLGNILQDPKKILFIFDGLDESRYKMDFTSCHFCLNPKQSGNSGQIVLSLLRTSLLKGCSILMTSRPTRLAHFACNVFQRIVEIVGCFPEERWMYFEKIFPIHELAEKAFNYVKQNEALYTLCYLPSYLWIICTVLSKSFQPTSSDQPEPLLPKTVTQVFTIYVAIILSNHSLDKDDAQKILQAIGWMAEHGVMNLRTAFDDRDLDFFHVDSKSRLFSSFLIKSEKPVTYSFLHPIVQEFFSALVHYTDYSAEKLKRSLEEAKSYSDGRGEIFLHFLCGLSDSSTRSILSGYLDTEAAQTSKEVVIWLKNLFPEVEKLIESKDKRRLLRIFYYVYEARNTDVVLELLKCQRRLDLSDVDVSPVDCTVLAFILGACKNIEELDFSRCSFDTERFARFAPALHTLQKLSLRLNDLPDTSCIQLSSVIRNNRSLKILDVSDNRLYGAYFSDLMEAIADSSIEELRLANNNLPDTSCFQLASVIRNNSYLKKLHLTFNSLAGPYFADLMDAMSSPDCRVEELRLDFNNLADSSCIQLASGIRNNRSLKILDLSDNHLYGPHFSGLTEALSSADCRIEELRLARNNLPDTSSIPLASVVRNNRSLKKLDLTGNRLYGPHFNDLIGALSSPDCRIEEILLRNNNLPNTSCIQLTSVLKNSPFIKKLDLTGNRWFAPQITDFKIPMSRKSSDTKGLSHKSSDDESSQEVEIAEVRNPEMFQKSDPEMFQMSNPEMFQMSNPEMFQMSNPEMSQMSDPEMSQMSDPEMSQMSNPEMSQMSNPEMSQMSDPEMSQMSNPEMFQMSNPEMSQMSDPEMSQMSDPEMSQMSNLEMSQMSDPEMSRISNREMSRMGEVIKEDDRSCKLCDKSQESVDVIAPTMIGSTYRLSIRSSGLFCCSESGIQFRVTQPVTLEYEVDSWSNYTEILQNLSARYEILGPLFNIKSKIEPNVVSAVYLPHCLCLGGFKGEKSLIKCFHYKDDNMAFETPSRIEAMYAVMENPTFSCIGIILYPLRLFKEGIIKRIPCHGMVLLFYNTIVRDHLNHMYRLHLYLLPRIRTVEKEVERDKKNTLFQRIYKPPQTETVYSMKNYRINGPQNANICPETLRFESCPPEVYSFTEIIAEGEKSTKINLSILSEDKDDPIWKSLVSAGEMLHLPSAKSGHFRPPPAQSVHFLTKYRADLISLIPETNQFLDDLLDLQLLNNEQYNSVLSQTTPEEKMRKVYYYIRSFSNEDKDKVYRSLKTHHYPVIKKLKNKDLED